MAIVHHNLPIILKACKRLRRRSRLLILGDANLFFTWEHLISTAEMVDYPLTGFDSQPHLNWESFGRALGFDQTDTLDINGKASITFNLHDPLPVDLEGKFDCVIDAGVSFWCFDPASAIRNISKLTARHGVVVHIFALSGHYGRGYYNIHPRTFIEFHEANKSPLAGFSIYCQDKPARLLPVRVLKKITAKLFPGHNYREIHDARPYFLRSGNSRICDFSNTLAQDEPAWIPNNAVGTLAFLKDFDGEPVIPIQTT